jgi:DNA-binding NarL/FixJ family response regulator
MIRVLVADDQSMIRQALQLYLKDEDDIELNACVDDGMKAIDKIEELHPDVALIDLEMPGIDGLTTTKIIGQRSPKTRTLILSSHDSQDYINKALEAGAKGYLNKNISAKDLATVIRFIHEGYFQLGPGLHEKISGNLGQAKQSKDDLVKLKENWSQQLNQIQSNFQEVIDSEHKLIYEKIKDSLHIKGIEIKEELHLDLDTELYNLKQEVEQGLRVFQQQVVNQMEEQWKSFKEHLNYQGLNEHNQEQTLMKIQLMQLREKYQKIEDKFSLSYKVFLLTIIGLTIILLIFFYV